MTSNISPFSLRHEWSIKWQERTRVHDNAMNWNSKVEDKLLPALATVGAISSLQLKYLFLNGDKKKISKLCSTGKLIRHQLVRNKQEIPIYTLGPTAIEMYKNKIQIVDWTEFTIPELLQRLIFFQFIGRLKKEKQEITIAPSVKPFVASFIRNERQIHVLIERGNEQEIIRTLKFYSPKERFIYIKEDVKHGQEINEYIKNCKVRLTTDSEMNHSFEDMFYKFENSQWIKENEVNEEQAIKVNTM
jgi:hypothetical protein